MSAKIPPIDRTSDVPVARSGEIPIQRPIDDPGARAVPELARRVLTEQLPVVRAVARNLVRNASEVEDLVQDVFEKALRSLDRIDLAANPRGWMVTILHNLHIDRCRRRSRMLPHVPHDEVAIAAPEVAEAPAWAAIDTDDVRRAVTRLPDELRETYVMFALEGRSYSEVAAALGIPKATVGTRLSRARTRLKEMLTTELAAGGTR